MKDTNSLAKSKTKLLVLDARMTESLREIFTF